MRVRSSDGHRVNAPLGACCRRRNIYWLLEKWYGEGGPFQRICLHTRRLITLLDSGYGIWAPFLLRKVWIYVNCKLVLLKMRHFLKMWQQKKMKKKWNEVRILLRALDILSSISFKNRGIDMITFDYSKGQFTLLELSQTQSQSQTIWPILGKKCLRYYWLFVIEWKITIYNIINLFWISKIDWKLHKQINTIVQCSPMEPLECGHLPS